MAVNAIFLLNGFLYSNWLSRLPDFEQRYAISHRETGLILLAVALGSILAMPFTGWLIAMNGSRRVTAVSATLFFVLVPVAIMMRSVQLLTGLLFCAGMALGIMDVAMNAQAVLVEKIHVKPLMSSFHAMYSGGMMSGAFTGALFTGWETSLVSHLSIIATVCLVCVVGAKNNLVGEKPQPTGNSEPAQLQWPPRFLWMMGAIAFCSMLGEGAMADWSTSYMQEIAHADATRAPLGLGAFAAAMMLGRLLGDRGRAKFGDGGLLVTTSVVAMCGLTIVIAFPSPLLVICGLLLVGLGLSVTVPVVYSSAGSLGGMRPGVGISIVTTIGYSGFLVGPPVIGFLADWKTLRFAIFFVGCLFAVMTILSVVHRRGQQNRAQTEPRTADGP